MQKIVLVGYGNVGKEVENVLRENNISADFIVKSSGIYAGGLRVGESADYPNYIDETTTVFISVPSIGTGEEMLHYYTDALARGVRIVTCEKAVIANNWHLIPSYPEKIRYSATVGGNSGILPAIREYKGKIEEIRAVVNGTLNYIANGLAEGKTQDEMYTEVMTKGFAEPGSRDFNEAIENELKDVAYKAAILANHSGLSDTVLTPANVSVEKYQEGARCAVVLRKNEIKAGFLPFEDTSWFPEGADNVLYINGQKAAEGPGAGGRATAERMFKDFQSF